MKINDKEELVNQQKEEILKSGKFAKIEIIVGEDESDLPYVRVETHCSTKTIAKALLCLGETKKQIEKDCPEAYLVSKFVLGIGKVKEVELNDEESEGE